VTRTTSPCPLEPEPHASARRGLHHLRFGAVLEPCSGSVPLSVPIPGPLRPARLVDRPNRFSVRVVVEPEETEVAAQLPAPGHLGTLLSPGARLWVRPEGGRGWSCVLVEGPGRTLVGLDPSLAKRLVGQALLEGAFPELDGWTLEQTDVLLGRARFDFLLHELTGAQLLMEVIALPEAEGGVARSFDGPAERATRQLESLTELARRPGWSAALVFVALRVDARAVAPNAQLDPRFAEALARASASGVRILARRAQLTLEESVLGLSIPVHLPRR
jgi:sugar fermentation stimulation protein A